MPDRFYDNSPPVPLNSRDDNIGYNIRPDNLFQTANSFADDMPMYLLDVRHMSKEKLDSYSPDLNAFFGFLVYDHTDEFDNFIAEHKQTFSDLPDQTIDALIEITHSPELEKYKKDYRTVKGEALSRSDS